MSERGPAGPSGFTVTVSFSPRRNSSSKFVLPLACCTMLMTGRSSRTSMNTTRPAAKSIGLYPSSACGRKATRVESGSRNRTSVSTTPVSSEPRTSPTSIEPDTAPSTTELATRASSVRPACVPTSALSAPRKQARSPTSDQSATPRERRILESLPDRDLHHNPVPEGLSRSQGRVGIADHDDRIRCLWLVQQWPALRRIAVVRRVDAHRPQWCREPDPGAGSDPHAANRDELLAALPHLPGVYKQPQAHPLRENRRRHPELVMEMARRVPAGGRSEHAAPDLLARLKRGGRIERTVEAVKNHVDARPELIASVAAHGVWTAAVKTLVGRHISDVLAGERDVARENRSPAHSPREHSPPPQGVVLRDLDLSPVEFVGRLRADEAGCVEQRRGGDAALGRIEDAVDPVAHRADRHRPELAAVPKEFAARFVAQPEQTAIDPVRRERPSHGIRISEGDGKPPAGVERDTSVSADRLAGVDSELGAPLGDETERGDVGAGHERRLSQRNAERVVEGIDRPRAGEGIAELIESRRLLGCATPELRQATRQVERARAAQEVMGRPAALHTEALHRRVAETKA